MLNRNTIAKDLYTAYCNAVGNVSFKGDPLPKWDAFANDPTHKPLQGWLAAADRVLEMLNTTPSN